MLKKNHINILLLYWKINFSSTISQVAGISFAFDPSKPPGSRVASEVVKIGDEYLSPKQMYRLAIKKYLHAGNDGFVMLPSCQELVSAVMQMFQIFLPT